MRARRLAVAALTALAACERGPLPFGAPMLEGAWPVGAQVSATTPGGTQVQAAVSLSDGGALLAGTFTGTVSFAEDEVLVDEGSGSGSGFVARYRGDGRLVWAVRIGGTGGVRVADLAAIGDDEAIAVGWFDQTVQVDATGGSSIVAATDGGNDIFVARFAADGSVRWLTRAGGPDDDIARAVAAVPAVAGAPEVIAVAGAIGSSVVFGSGDAIIGPSPAGAGPIYVARLNGDGTFATVSYAGGGIPGQAYGVVADGAGNITATGYVNGEARFGTTAAGAPVTVDGANARAFVAQWDGSGQLAWAQGLAGEDGEGDAIALGPAGEVVVSGRFMGQAPFGDQANAPVLQAGTSAPGVFLAALDGAGNTLWARRLADVGFWPWRLRAASAGRFLAAGLFGAQIVLDPDGPSPLPLVSAGDYDALFLRVAPDGSLDWAFRGGGPGNDAGYDIAEAPDGSAWAVGDFVGPAVFGAGDAVQLQSGTGGTGFLLHLNP